MKKKNQPAPALPAAASRAKVTAAGAAAASRADESSDDDDDDDNAAKTPPGTKTKGLDKGDSVVADLDKPLPAKSRSTLHRETALQKHLTVLKKGHYSCCGW